jgi:hypothetical protein
MKSPVREHASSLSDREALRLSHAAGTLPSRKRGRLRRWRQPVLAVAALLGLVGSGCPPGSLPTLPTTYLLLGTPSLFGPRGAPGSVALQAFSSPDGVRWTSVGPPNGPCPDAPGNPVTAACARADIAPGLSNSPTQYVAAWWGQENDANLPRNDFNFGCYQHGSMLFISTHSPSRAGGWSTPTGVFCFASGDLDAMTRPAVARLPSTDQWFAAFRDANDGSITVLPIPVPGTTPASAPIPVPAVQSTTAVAFGALNSTTLVLAVGSGAAIRVMTSANGMPFVPAGGTIALEASGPLTSGASGGTFAPYLSSGADGLLLAVARSHPGAGQGNDILVFTSSDGITWTRQGAAESIGGASGLYTPAANGVSTSPVVAFPNYPITNTNVVYQGRTVTVPLNQQSGVALAFGPTPTL